MVVLLVGLSACAQGTTQPQSSVAADQPPSDPAVIVSAALRHFLERDPELAAEPTNWLLVIDAGPDSQAVVARLSEFPVTVTEPANIKPDPVRRRDPATGKKVAVWYAELVQPGPAPAAVIVRCFLGGRSGFQDRVLLEWAQGHWVVVEVQNQWIS